MPTTNWNCRTRPIATLVASAMILFAACDDPTGFDESYLASDTLTIATPTEANWGMPSAIDITADGIFFGGERYPEHAAHAGRWDFALREYGRSLILVPAKVIGFESAAAISPALVAEDFDALTAVPTHAGLSADIPAVLHLGRVYVARSRRIDCFTSTGYYAGQQYAKLQPVAIEVETGTVRLVVTTNSLCDDWRLQG